MVQQESIGPVWELFSLWNEWDNAETVYSSSGDFYNITGIAKNMVSLISIDSGLSDSNK